MENRKSEISQRSEEPLLSQSVRGNLPPKIKLDTLTRVQILGYSVGHFQNDLCAACWFNYLLYFMKNVIFKGQADSGFYAGIVLLSGQLADGFATPLVGFLSDKTNTRIGKRTPWFLFGTVMVTICFVFIFQHCLLCDWFNSDSQALLIFYYCFFPAAFNVGWAAVQVSHMSLVPSLTLSRKTRDKLNNYRNTFTYIANLYVLILAFFLFLLLDCDYTQFMILTLASLGVGFLTSLVFLATVNERKITADCRKIKNDFKKQHIASLDSECSVPAGKLDRLEKMAEAQASAEENQQSLTNMKVQRIQSDDDNFVQSDNENWQLSDDEEGVHISKKKNQTVISSYAEEVVNWKQWFGVSAFYIYGFVYMACRLLVNVQSSLIIFYLQNVLGIAQNEDTYANGLPIQFAIIPMTIYLASTITSTFLKTVYQKIGRKMTFAIGAIAALIGIITMMFLTPSSTGFMYPLAVFIGVGQSISLNTAIALIGEVVGVKGSSGAFVFGVYSLLDKFSSGIALYLVMNLRDVSLPINSDYLRICTCVLPGVAILLAWFLIVIGKAADYDAGDAVLENPEKKSDQGINN